jgi:hypothetical protein
MFRNKYIFTLGILAIVFLLMPHATFAQAGSIDAAQGTYGDCNKPNDNGFVPLACYSNSRLVQQAFDSGSLPQYINSVFTIVLSVGAIAAVLRIAYGGYMYMGSADMWGNKQQAKEIIRDAIVGLLLLFAIYLILNQINPNLLNLDIMKQIKDHPVPTTPTTP